LELGKCPASGVRQDEIEIGKSVGGDVGDGLPFVECVEGDGSIQVIKHAKPSMVMEDSAGGRERIGAVGSYDTDVGVAKIFRYLGANFFPSFVENDAGAGNFREVAILGVEGEVSFIEDGKMAALDKGAKQCTPERGVAIAPGRGKG